MEREHFPGPVELRARDFRRRSDIEKTNAGPGDTELRIAMETAALGIFDYYPQSGELRWSPAAKAHFGLSPDAHVNYNVFLVGLHPRDRERADRLVRETLQRENEGKYAAEYRTIGIEDGRERWIASRGRAFFNERGEAVRLTGTTQDITERKRAELKIAHLASIPEMNPNPIVELDLEGNVTYVNPALSRRFPDLREKGTSHPLLAHWPQIDSGLRAGKQSVIFQEVEADGRTLHQTVYYARQWNLIRIFHSDITDRKQAERDRERLIAELRRSNEELEQFARAVSHDLQEPLRGVSSYVDLLAKTYAGKLDETAGKYISYALEGAGRMSSLINDLLAYARITTRAAPFARVDMNRALDRALGNLRKSLGESGAAITRDEMPETAGDETQLTQVLRNLIGNAVKFRNRSVDPQIHISAECREEELVLGVHDNGIGIEPGSRERIFEIFQRLHTREEYPGTGIGLALCRKIVERHGGRIWAESKQGEGSTFYFTLPVRER